MVNTRLDAADLDHLDFNPLQPNRVTNNKFLSIYRLIRMRLIALPAALLALVALCVPAAAFPHPEPDYRQQEPLPLPPPRPLVIWHGLGRYN